MNDQHGHAIEDLVLIKITELIKANSREIDLLARCGGKAVVLWEEIAKLGCDVDCWKIIVHHQAKSISRRKQTDCLGDQRLCIGCFL